MDVIEALKTRRTVRQYDATYTIPRDHLERLIDAALNAPTGGDLQELDILVLADRAKIDAATKISFDSWPVATTDRWNGRHAQYGVANVVSCDASAIFFFVANERAATVPFSDIDAGIQAMAVMAAARGFGCHTKCLGALQWGNKARLEAFLGIPEGRMAMALAVGEPKDRPLVLPDKQRLCNAPFSHRAAL
jgi:nitroreductase